MDATNEFYTVLAFIPRTPESKFALFMFMRKIRYLLWFGSVFLIANTFYFVQTHFEVIEKPTPEVLYQAARKYYITGKYDECAQLLAVLHDRGEVYENSHEIASFCVQGQELVKRQKELERFEATREEDVVRFICAGGLKKRLAKISKRSLASLGSRDQLKEFCKTLNGY